MTRGRMESMRLIFLRRVRYKSRARTFSRLRGGFSLSEANQALGALTGPFLAPPAPGLAWLCWGWFISVYSGGPHCVLLLRPCISFAGPFVLRFCRRWTEGTESELRRGLGPLVSRFLGGGLTLEKVRESVVIQLYLNAHPQSLVIILDCHWLHAVKTTWPKVFWDN